MVIDERGRDDAVEALEVAQGVDGRAFVGIFNRHDDAPAVGRLMDFDAAQRRQGVEGRPVAGFGIACTSTPQTFMDDVLR